MLAAQFTEHKHRRSRLIDKIPALFDLFFYALFELLF